MTVRGHELPLLVIVEREDAVFVCDNEDHDDWLVRFERSATFDAMGWAWQMVRRSRTTVQSR